MMHSQVEPQEAVLDEVDGEVGDVDPDPRAGRLLRVFAVEGLDGVDGRPASTERIEHHVAGARGGADNPLE